MPGSARSPSRHQPPQGFQYLELIDKKFEEISKLNVVLMGNPAGRPDAGRVQILQERGMAAFKTPLDSLVDAARRDAVDCAPERVVAALRSAQGENTREVTVRGDGPEGEGGRGCSRVPPGRAVS
jgi:hypothetical protein